MPTPHPLPLHPPVPARPCHKEINKLSVRKASPVRDFNVRVGTHSLVLAPSTHPSTPTPTYLPRQLPSHTPTPGHTPAPAYKHKRP